MHRARLFVLVLAAVALAACDQLGATIPVAETSPTAGTTAPPPGGAPVAPPPAAPAAPAAPVAPVAPAVPGAVAADLPAQIVPDIDAAGAQPWSCAEGADCTITGKVVLDRSATVGNLTVAAGAQLVVADVPLTLTADEIVVDGHLQMGTRAAPNSAAQQIVLNGTDPARDVGRMGANVLGSRGEGVVKVYGARQDGFRSLASTAESGATTVTLDAPLDVRAGDRVVVGAAGLGSQSEVRTVTATDGTSVTLDAPLASRHLGVTQTHAGRDLVMRAPVGVLERTIRVTTGPDAADAGLRAHTHFMGAVVEVAGVRMEGMGRPELGRYPLHAHDMGDASGSLFCGNVVEDSDNRAIVTHLSDYVHVCDNVVHDVAGFGLMIGEDGPETGNVVARNLVTASRGGLAGTQLRPNEEHGANAWAGNASHTWVDNDLAGGAAWGLLVEAGDQVVGLAATQGRPERPDRDFPFGYYRGNATHNSVEPEPAHVCVFFSCGTGVQFFTDAPVPADQGADYGQNGDELGYTNGLSYGAVTSVIADHTTYANDGFGVWAGSFIGFKRLASADNREHVFGAHLRVDDSLVVGDSGFGADTAFDEVTGIFNYDGQRNVTDTHFARFGPDDAALGVFTSYTDEEIGFYGVGAVQRLTFEDVARPFFIREGDQADRAERATCAFWVLDDSVPGIPARTCVTFLSDPNPAGVAVPEALAKLVPESAAPAELTQGPVSSAPPATLPDLPEPTAPAAPAADVALSPSEVVLATHRARTARCELGPVLA